MLSVSRPGLEVVSNHCVTETKLTFQGLRSRSTGRDRLSGKGRKRHALRRGRSSRAATLRVPLVEAAPR